MKVYLSNCGFLCIDSGSVPGMTEGDADITDKFAEEVEVPRMAEADEKIVWLFERVGVICIDSPRGTEDSRRSEPGMTAGDDVGVEEVLVGDGVGVLTGVGVGVFVGTKVTTAIVGVGESVGVGAGEEVGVDVGVGVGVGVGVTSSRYTVSELDGSPVAESLDPVNLLSFK